MGIIPNFIFKLYLSRNLFGFCFFIFDALVKLEYLMGGWVGMREQRDLSVLFVFFIFYCMLYR